MAQQQDPPFQTNPHTTSGAPYSPWSGEVATGMISSGQSILPASNSGQTANVLRDYETQSTAQLSAPQSVTRTTPYTPNSPSYTNPSSQTINVPQNYDAYINPSPELLYYILGEYDRIISSRLSSFSTSLDRLTENHETFTSSATKLDNHSIAIDEKFNRLIRDVDMKLNGWTERLEASLKTTVKEALAEALKNSSTDRDRYYNRILGMLVENTKRTQNSLETINTSVGSLRSRQTALVDLMEKRGVCENSSSSPSNFEAHTNDLTRLRSEFSKRITDAEEVLKRLANSINVARNEAHAGRVQLTNMIDKAHQAEKGQLKMLQEDMRSLKTTVGIDDNPSDISMEELSEGTEGRQIPPSLAGRIGFLERVIREEIVLLHSMMGTRFNSPSNIASTTVSVSATASMRVCRGLSNTTDETRYSVSHPHANSLGLAPVGEEGESAFLNDPHIDRAGFNIAYETHEGMQLHLLAPSLENTEPKEPINEQERLRLAQLKRQESLNDMYSDGCLSPLSPLSPSPPASEYTPSSANSDSESDDDIGHELRERRSSSRPRVPYLLRPADMRRNAKPTSPLPIDVSAGLKLRLKPTKGSKIGKDAKSGGPRSIKKRKLIDGTELPLAPKRKSGRPPKRKVNSQTGKDSNAEGQVIGSTDVVWPVMTNEDVDFNRRLIQCNICLNHYHFRCAGLLKGDRRVEVLEEPYNCPLCSFQALRGMKPSNLASPEGVQAHGGSCNRPDCDQSDNSEVFVIEKILGRALTKRDEEGRCTEIWLVKWEGCSVASHSEWLPTASIGNSKGLIDEFYQQARVEGLNCKNGETAILKEAFDDA